MRITNDFQTADKDYILDYILCSMPAWQQKELQYRTKECKGKERSDKVIQSFKLGTKVLK